MSSSDEDPTSASADEIEASDSESEEALPPIQLPDRTTRGKRVAQVSILCRKCGKLLEDEGSADEDFWNQEFFEEEAEDVEYNSSNASESEAPDVPDSDFDESEEEEDSGGDEEEDKKRSRRPQLKPPGAKKPPSKRPLQPRRELLTSDRPPRETRASDNAATEAPTLRQSTRRRVEDAEKERTRAEQQTARLKKKRIEPEVPLLTQEELLAEAAQTEIENIKSLQTLVAQEEEVKKKAVVKKSRYTGPMVRFRSKDINGEAVTSVEVMNMLVPPELRPQVAPPYPDPVYCVVTGQPASYQDPQTGLPYANRAAFRELRARMMQGRPLSLKTPIKGQPGTSALAHYQGGLT